MMLQRSRYAQQLAKGTPGAPDAIAEGHAIAAPFLMQLALGPIARAKVEADRAAAEAGMRKEQMGMLKDAAQIAAPAAL